MVLVIVRDAHCVVLLFLVKVLEKIRLCLFSVSGGAGEIV